MTTETSHLSNTIKVIRPIRTISYSDVEANLCNEFNSIPKSAPLNDRCHSATSAFNMASSPDHLYDEIADTETKEESFSDEHTDNSRSNSSSNSSSSSKSPAIAMTPKSKNTFDRFRILLENGCDPNVKSADGFTALYYSGGDPAKVKLLLKYKADPNICSKSGMSPLHVAVNNDQYESVKMLIKAGANVNQICKVENTSPLHVALLCNVNFNIIQYLIDNGANVNAVTKNGKTPLRIAIEQQNLYAVNYLILSGATV